MPIYVCRRKIAHCNQEWIMNSKFMCTQKQTHQTVHSAMRGVIVVKKNACSTWIAWIGACIYLLIHLFISYFVWAHGCVIIKFCLGSIKTDALSIRLVRISTRIQYTEIRKRAAQKLMHRIYQHGCGGLLHLIAQFPHNAERENSAI